MYLLSENKGAALRLFSHMRKAGFLIMGLKLGQACVFAQCHQRCLHVQSMGEDEGYDRTPQHQWMAEHAQVNNTLN